MPLSTLNSFRRQMKWTMQNTKLNSLKPRLNTKSQSLSGSLFFPTRIYDFWNCTTTFYQNMWCKLVRRVGKGHRLFVSCSCPEGAERLYKPWNGSRVGATAVRSKSCTHGFTADAFGNFFPPNLLWQARKTWQERTWSAQRGIQVFLNAVSWN